MQAGTGNIAYMESIQFITNRATISTGCFV